MSPIKTVKQILEWSFSRWKKWKTCPRSAKYQYIDKLIKYGEEEQSATQQAGSDMHALAIEWATKKLPNGKTSKLKQIPQVLKAFEKEFDALRKSKVPVIAENVSINPFKFPRDFAKFAWGLTKDWRLCGYFEKGVVWTRMKVDTHLFNLESKVLTIIDYKSGKIYPEDHEKQGSLYAIGGFAKYPEARTVNVKFWYTDQEEEKVYIYTRDQLPALQRMWNREVLPMLRDVRFQTRPGRHCSWCPFSIKEGGPCEN
jgi:hypothetical protein